MNKWIVGEPPKKSGEYLVSTKNEFVVVARYLTGMGWNGQYKNCVVAWQELPKPYKPESNFRQRANSTFTEGCYLDQGITQVF